MPGGGRAALQARGRETSLWEIPQPLDIIKVHQGPRTEVSSGNTPHKGGEGSHGETGLRGGVTGAWDWDGGRREKFQKRFILLRC